MAACYRRYTPDQEPLLPPSLHDWLPEGHLPYFIADVAGQMDLREFHERYEQVEEDVAYRVLAARNFPAHRTIAEFRQQNLQAFEKLFVQVVRVARGAGVKRLGMLAVDGTKLRAKASKHKAMSYGRMREKEVELEAEIAALMARAAAQDAAEDREHGAENRGDELPEELRRREQRLKAIRAAKARLEARQAEADGKQGRTPGDGRKGKGGNRLRVPMACLPARRKTTSPIPKVGS